MEYSIQALARLAGVSARTLRYYDEIGLLKPCRVSTAGYRIYGQTEVDLLQQILFYRALDFSLDEIGRIVHAPDFDRLDALCAQRERLRAEQARLTRLLEAIETTIRHEKGEYHMNDTEKFEALKWDAVARNEAAYGAEAREKYGDAAVDTANRNMLGMTQEKYDTYQALEAQILQALAQAVRAGDDPHGETGRAIAGLHRRWLTHTIPDCTAQMHTGIAALYTADERFTAYYDRETSGCAQFLCDAVTFWADKL